MVRVLLMKHGNTFPSQHFPVKYDTAYGTAVPYCTREMILGHANCRTAPTEQQHLALSSLPCMRKYGLVLSLCVLVPSCSLRVFNDFLLNSFITLNSMKSRVENYVVKGGM